MPDKLRAAEMLGREGSERDGDKDTGQQDEPVPAAGRDELFAEEEDSDDKIDEPGKRHPEI